MPKNCQKKLRRINKNLVLPTVKSTFNVSNSCYAIVMRPGILAV